MFLIVVYFVLYRHLAGDLRNVPLSIFGIRTSDTRAYYYHLIRHFSSMSHRQTDKGQRQSVAFKSIIHFEPASECFGVG
jgi:hypothetical protein